MVAQARGEIPAELIDRAQTIDWAMHDTIIDSLGNRIISDAYRVNAIKIRLIKQEQTRLNDAVVVSTMQEHLRIIEALEARNPTLSSDVMRQHIEAARKRAVDQT
ncbi:MAG: FCD domain-containing protein [Proteobacteria bacterium]|nr:FCD domain-containing protein [Pseudomonadota bacterium]